MSFLAKFLNVRVLLIVCLLVYFGGMFYKISLLNKQNEELVKDIKVLRLVNEQNELTLKILNDSLAKSLRKNQNIQKIMTKKKVSYAIQKQKNNDFKDGNISFVLHDTFKFLQGECATCEDNLSKTTYLNRTFNVRKIKHSKPKN